MIFVFMALPGLVETIFGTTTSVYNLLDDAGGIVVAFIFDILAFLVAACLLTLTLLGKNKVPFAEFICLGAALLAFVAFILFWFTESMALDGNTTEAVKLGVGAVLCAISSLFVACGLCCYGLKKFLKK